MIWNPQVRAEETESALAAHLAAQMAELYGSGGAAAGAGLQEVARAIEFFVGHDVASGCVDANRVTLLASQALSSLGDRVAARRLLVFGTALVRPSEWEATLSKHMWCST
jgi:hypothetical protein